MTYQEIAEIAEDIYRQTRRLHRYVNSPTFIRVWERLSSIQKQAISNHVKSLDLWLIKKLIIEHYELEEKNMGDLRKMASKLGIKYASNYTKEELLGLIYERRTAK
jgi:hypothetical protein